MPEKAETVDLPATGDITVDDVSFRYASAEGEGPYVLRERILGPDRLTNAIGAETYGR